MHRCLSVWYLPCFQLTLTRLGLTWLASLTWLALSFFWLVPYSLVDSHSFRKRATQFVDETTLFSTRFVDVSFNQVDVDVREFNNRSLFSCSYERESWGRFAKQSFRIKIIVAVVNLAEEGGGTFISNQISWSVTLDKLSTTLPPISRKRNLLHFFSEKFEIKINKKHFLLSELLNSFCLKAIHKFNNFSCQNFWPNLSWISTETFWNLKIFTSSTTTWLMINLNGFHMVFCPWGNQIERL